MRLPVPGLRSHRRRPRALILGLPYFGSRLAGILSGRGWDACYLPHPGRSPAGWARVAWKLARADVLYLVSARAERGSPLDWLLRSGHRRPVVIHWVGTDVLIARQESDRGRISPRIVRQAIHWTDTPWLIDELAEVGIRAEPVPLPVAGLDVPAPPLPARFTVLLYLPVDAFDREVFDIETILRLPAAFPGVRFVLVPSPAESLPGPLPPNLETPGWVADMDAVYRETTVLARLVSHDGLPFTVLEAMARGRHVLYSYPLPGVTVVSGFEEAHAAIVAWKDRHERGELGLNEQGMRWVRAQYRFDEIASELDQRLRSIAYPRRNT